MNRKLNNKRSFIFIKYGMEIGGIETFLFKFIKWLNKKNIRVIFIMLAGTKIADKFKKEFLNKNIEIYEVDIYSKDWNKKLKISGEKNETFLAYAFNLYQFALLQKIILENNLVADIFFWVPHFAEYLFLEKEFFFPFKFIMKKYFGKILQKMEFNNNIIYVNHLHGEALRKNYNIKIENLEEKLVEVIPNKIYPFDYTKIREKSKRKKFNIITVTRFVFPHKIYLLGLIESYGILKQKYPNLTLTIIGYGRDEEYVKKEISKLNEKAQEDINLIGKVEYEELREYFEKAHLNIGVAGTICDGASLGVISIPVRHYNRKCEGYGYLPKSKNYIISDKEGIPIEYYIEELIKMDENKFIKLCEESYNTFTNINIGEYWKKTLDQTNKKTGRHVIPYLFMQFVYWRYLLAYKLKILMGKK